MITNQHVFEPYIIRHITHITVFHSDPAGTLIAITLAAFEVAVVAYFYNRRDE
jgi:hypothetical protein